MDELREVKLEDESEEDVAIQMSNDAPDGSIPKYTIVGTLKRKRVVSSEYAKSKLAPSKNSQIFENPPKLEPLERVQESSSNLAPFFGNLHENQIVKQEEPTEREPESSCFSNFPSIQREPKDELVEKGTYETEVYAAIENPIGTVWDQRAPFSLGLEMAEVKEEEPLDAPYELHQPLVLNEPKLEEQCASQDTLWALVKEEEEPEWGSEAYETSGYQLEEPKVEEPYLSTGPASDHNIRIPKYTIWDQRDPSTKQGVYASHGSSWDSPIKQEEEALSDNAPGSDYEVPESPTLDERQPAHCCLCGAAETSQRHLTNVHFKSELLILAVGRTMAGKLTVQKGQELMTRTQSSYSCQEHYREANEMVENAFVVETPCTSLHLTVMRNMCPQMTMERFRQRCLEFHKWDRKKEPAVTSHCEICNRDQHRTEMTSVSLKSTKYLLAIADMLQGYRQPAQAVAFASGSNAAKHVCMIHFQSTLNVILERLNLRSVSEQPLALNLEKLMSSVRMVWKDCKAKFFWNTVRRFTATQQLLKPLSATTPRPPPPHRSRPKPTLPVLVCSLCSKNSPFVQPVKESQTKLVLAVGACLSKHTEPTSAKEFVAGDETTALVCRSHFNFSIPSILGHLRIESLSETPATKLALHVMSLVHSISSTYSTRYEDFIGMVAAFAEDHQLAVSSPTTSRPPRPPRWKPPKSTPTVPVFPCSLCSKNSPAVRQVNDRNTKLVLAVGACLSNHTAPSCAKKFVAGDETALVCRSHFDSSIHQILTTLQIKSLSDSPATGLALNVMSLVHLISSTKRIEYQEFIGMIAAFTEEHHLPASR